MMSVLYIYITGVLLSATVLAISPPDWATLTAVGPVLLPLVGGLLYGLGTVIGKYIGGRVFPDHQSAALSLRERWNRWRRRKLQRRKNPLGLDE